ncbi:hypothetical protein SY83_13415 [Paenibacillus swuensis]|uniref:histidine kinase n=1 Tax=Paenibacillus swuensis TaxID=1178515 RepID=A0A172TJL1_9BACL|nr:histidine kinase [Paenibacillus swuensis]ANE47094.1 hypothetical protein SY83_13415 [Paenibacillus swuensis]
MQTPFWMFLKKSFYVRTVMIMLLVCIVPLFLLALLSIQSSKSILEAEVNKVNYQVVSQVGERMDSAFSRIKQFSYQNSLLSLVDRMEVAQTQFDDIEQKRRIADAVDAETTVIEDLGVFLSLYTDITGDIFTSTRSTQNLTKFQNITPLAQSPFRGIVENFMEQGLANSYLDKSQNHANPLLNGNTFYLRKVPYNSYDEARGVLVITIPDLAMRKLVSHIDLGPQGSVSIITDSGEMIATSNSMDKTEFEERTQALLTRWESQGKPDQFTDHASMISMYRPTTFGNWLVMSEIPIAQITAKTLVMETRVKLLLFMMLGLGVVSVIGLGYYLYRPLQTVKRHIAHIKHGHLETSFPTYPNNEIGELGGFLNNMTHQLHTVIEELRTTEEMKRRSEIRALQSQINPHFLYNCLNTVSAYALMNDTVHFKELMNRLFALLRYSMENYEQTVALRKEIAYLGDYLYMMELRYGYKLAWQVSVDESLLDISIPKLLLQPLVENALFHGILPQGREQGKLTLMSREDPVRQTVQLIISDDGEGISADKLEQLRMYLNRPDIDENIGLKNVAERVRLLYGSEASMDIQSEPGQGTQITLILPLHRIHHKKEVSST